MSLRTTWTVRVLIVTCALALLIAQPALGDGDPASDVLLGADIFYPYAPVQPSVERAFNAATAAFAQHRQALKVAIIANADDLGAIPQVFDMPQAYAAFLDVELSYYDPHGPLLVVMPDGFGARHFSARALAVIRSLPKPASDSATGLVTAALGAEQAIARVDGFSVSSLANAVSAGGGGGLGGRTALVVLLAAIAVVGAAGLVVDQRRR